MRRESATPLSVRRAYNDKLKYLAIAGFAVAFFTFAFFALRRDQYHQQQHARSEVEHLRDSAMRLRELEGHLHHVHPISRPRQAETDSQKAPSQVLLQPDKGAEDVEQQANGVLHKFRGLQDGPQLVQRVRSRRKKPAMDGEEWAEKHGKLAD